MRTRFVAARVLPDSKRSFAPGAVVVSEGRIEWVGPAGASIEADETVELDDAVITPGLVNAHSHLDLTHLRGQVDYRDDFADWIQRIVGRRREPGIGPAARAGLREAVGRGTTSFGDIVSMRTFGEIVAAFAECGARGRLFVEMVGLRPELADRVFAEAWERIEMRPLPERVETGFSPHAPYSVSRQLFARAVAVADGHSKPLAVHLAETLEELAFVRHGIGPLRELGRKLGADDPDFEPYGSIEKVLAQLHMERGKLLLVHGNYLRPRQVPAGAHVVYCPTAHHFFGHPEHPVRDLVEEGVRVALGSDSAASGETTDTLSETQFLARARLDLDPKTVFQMATEWGATALDLDSGRLEPGRWADLAAFEPAAGHEVLGLTDARCILTVIGGAVEFDGR